MSMNECQCVVCFAMPQGSIAVAGFALAVCKLQSDINSLKCNLVCSTNKTLG